MSFGMGQSDMIPKSPATFRVHSSMAEQRSYKALMMVRFHLDQWLRGGKKSRTGSVGERFRKCRRQTPCSASYRIVVITVVGSSPAGATERIKTIYECVGIGGNNPGKWAAIFDRCGLDSRKDKMTEPKKCVLCEAELMPVNDDWKYMQPYGGCEIRIIGAYGSAVLDESIESTVRTGVICDSCVEKLLPQMEKMK